MLTAKYLIGATAVCLSIVSDYADYAHESFYFCYKKQGAAQWNEVLLTGAGNSFRFYANSWQGHYFGLEAMTAYSAYIRTRNSSTQEWIDTSRQVSFTTCAEGSYMFEMLPTPSGVTNPAAKEAEMRDNVITPALNIFKAIGFQRGTHWCQIQVSTSWGDTGGGTSPANIQLGYDPRSGDSYINLGVLLHEMRHCYGINRNSADGTVINLPNAIKVFKFQCNNPDAFVKVYFGHSNFFNNYGGLEYPNSHLMLVDFFIIKGMRGDGDGVPAGGNDIIIVDDADFS